MLAVTPFSVKKEASKNNNTIVAVREEKPDPEASPGEAEDQAGEQHSDDQKHKEKCNICQSKVGLSPSTYIQYSHWSKAS